MDKQEKIIIIATVAMLVLAAVIVVLVWGAYSNWFKTEFEHIYLSSNGKRLQQSDVYRFGNVKLDVHQFGGKSGYSVKIELAPDEDFVYKVDGAFESAKLELASKDLSRAFRFELQKKSFVLHGRVDLLSVLQAVYPNSAIELVSELDQQLLFRLIVTDKAAKHNFVLMFRSGIGVTNIELSPGHIYM